MKRQHFLSIVLTVGIIAAVGLLYSTAPSTAAKQDEPIGLPVEATTIQPQTIPRYINAHGTIEAVSKVALSAELSGRVVYIRKDLEEGATVNAGEVLFKIDQIDYRSAVTRAENAVKVAKAELQLEEGQQKVALRELQQLKKMQPISKADERLVLRQPQLERAKAIVAQATSDLEIAQANLKRTEIRAPFDAYVTQKTIALGQYVAPGMSVIELTDRTALHIRLPLKKSDLSYVVEGMPVDVTSATSAQPITGKILHVLPQLRTKSQMGQVLVRIDNANSLNGKRHALRIGDYVPVTIAAGDIQGAYPIPSHAYRESGHIAIADASNQMTFVPAVPVWRTDELVYVDVDIKDTELVITSPVNHRQQGYKVLVLGTSHE